MDSDEPPSGSPRADQLRKELAEELREARNKAGLTQKQCAERVAVERSHISNVERNVDMASEQLVVAYDQHIVPIAYDQPDAPRLLSLWERWKATSEEEKRLERIARHSTRGSADDGPVMPTLDERSVRLRSPRYERLPETSTRHGARPADAQTDEASSGKSRPGRWWLLVAAVLCVTAAAVILSSGGPSSLTPKAIALRGLEAFAAGDWGALERLLDRQVTFEQRTSKQPSTSFSGRREVVARLTGLWRDFRPIGYELISTAQERGLVSYVVTFSGIQRKRLPAAERPWINGRGPGRVRFEAHIVAQIKADRIVSIVYRRIDDDVGLPK